MTKVERAVLIIVAIVLVVQSAGLLVVVLDLHPLAPPEKETKQPVGLYPRPTPDPSTHMEAAPSFESLDL